jgi:hypothetical protein
MVATEMRLGERLVSEGATTSAALDAALARQRTTGERIGSALIALGVDADAVARALAGQKSVVPACDAELAAVSPALRRLVPDELVRRLWAVPLRVATSGELVVAVRNPDDTASLAELEHAVGGPIRPAAAAELRLRQAIAGVLPTSARAQPAAVSPQPAAVSPQPTPGADVPAPWEPPPWVPPPRVPLSNVELDSAGGEVRIRASLAYVILAVCVVGLAIGGHHAWGWLSRPEFPVSSRPIKDLVGMRIPSLDDDWRGPQELDWTSPRGRGLRKNIADPPQSAMYGRGRAGDRVRDYLILYHQPPGATLAMRWHQEGGGPADKGYEPGLVVVAGMSAEPGPCVRGNLRADAETIECTGTGSWDDRKLEIRQIYWIDSEGGERAITGITFGSLQDIAADVDEAAASAQVY